MRNKSYGSWTVAVDVAGRVAKERTVSIVTVGAVAIPAEVLKQVSHKVRAAFPDSKPKWSAGGLPFLRTALKVVEGYKLPVVMLRITGVGTEVWRTFWDDGQQLSKQLSQKTSGTVGFTKSAHIVRIILCSLAFSRMVVHILQLRNHKTTSPGEPGAAIDLHVAHDADIQQTDTIEIIRGGLKKWAESYAPRLGLKPQVHVSFAGKEAQPLVMLADYIAGSFYVTDPDQTSFSGESRASHSTDEVGAILDAFRRRHGSLLRLDEKTFSETYPVSLEKGRLIRRRWRLWDGGPHPER